LVSTFTICSTAFESLARLVAKSLKFEDPAIGFVQHPLGGIAAAELEHRVDQVWPGLAAWLEHWVGDAAA
jgi:hypothetical protein